MNLKVFYLNENKYLELSSQKSFLDSCRDGKSHYLIDVEKPDPTSFAEFVSSQELHPLVLEGCLEPVMTSPWRLTSNHYSLNYQHSLTGIALTNLFYPLSVYPRPSSLLMRNP
jgi:hypothetical protein